VAVPLEGRLARGAAGASPSWLAVLLRARLASGRCPSPAAWLASTFALASTFPAAALAAAFLAFGYPDKATAEAAADEARRLAADLDEHLVSGKARAADGLADHCNFKHPRAGVPRPSAPIRVFRMVPAMASR
jgi:hypothetical protein